MDNLDDGNYGDCPSCGGDYCEFCQGDGVVDEFEQAQQLDRVLICALDDRAGIPPLYVQNIWNRERAARAGAPDHFPILAPHHTFDLRLSRTAAARAREMGYLHWYCSVFGDELRLTEKGEIRAREAMRDRGTMLAMADGY